MQEIKEERENAQIYGELRINFARRKEKDGSAMKSERMELETRKKKKERGESSKMTNSEEGREVAGIIEWDKGEIDREERLGERSESSGEKREKRKLRGRTRQREREREMQIASER